MKLSRSSLVLAMLLIVGCGGSGGGGAAGHGGAGSGGHGGGGSGGTAGAAGQDASADAATDMGDAALGDTTDAPHEAATSDASDAASDTSSDTSSEAASSDAADAAAETGADTAVAEVAPDTGATTGTFNGSCDTRTAASICTEYYDEPANNLTQVMTVCSTATGTWDAANKCPNAGKVGGCRRTNTATLIFWYYSAPSAATGMTNCAAQNGTWLQP